MAFKSPETSNVGNGVGRPSLDREDMFRRACSKSLSSNYQQLVEAAVEFKYLATMHKDKDAESRLTEIINEQPKDRRQPFLTDVLQGIKERMKSA